MISQHHRIVTVLTALILLDLLLGASLGPSEAAMTADRMDSGKDGWLILLLKEKEFYAIGEYVNLTLHTFYEGSYADIGLFFLNLSTGPNIPLNPVRVSTGQYSVGFILNESYFNDDYIYKFEISLKAEELPDDYKEQYWTLYTRPINQPSLVAVMIMPSHHPNKPGGELNFYIRTTKGNPLIDVDELKVEGESVSRKRIDEESFEGTYILPGQPIDKEILRVDIRAKGKHKEINSTWSSGLGIGHPNVYLYHVWSRWHNVTSSSAEYELDVVDWEGRPVKNASVKISYRLSPSGERRNATAFTDDFGLTTLNLTYGYNVVTSTEIIVNDREGQIFWSYYSPNLIAEKINGNYYHGIAGNPATFTYRLYLENRVLPAQSKVTAVVASPQQIVQIGNYSVAESGLVNISFTPSSCLCDNNTQDSSYIYFIYFENGTFHHTSTRIDLHDEFNFKVTKQWYNMSIILKNTEGKVWLGKYSNLTIDLPPNLTFDWYQDYRLKSPAKLLIILPDKLDSWQPPDSFGFRYSEIPLWPNSGSQNINLSLPSFLEVDNITLRLELQLDPKQGGLVYQDFTFSTAQYYRPVLPPPSPPPPPDHSAPLAAALIASAAAFAAAAYLGGWHRERRLTEERRARLEALKQTQEAEKAERQAKMVADHNRWRPNENR